MINPEKTSMIFTKKFKPGPIEPLKLWDKEINYTNSMKYLEVHLDPKMSWKTYFEEKRKKLYTSVGLYKNHEQEFENKLQGCPKDGRRSLSIGNITKKAYQ